METTAKPYEVLQWARRFLTQAEIASVVGRDTRTVRRWENCDIDTPPVIVPALREAVSRKIPTKSTGGGDFTFSDLFAGIGGIRAGFEQSGGECVFTSEWNEMATRTYKENFGESHPIAGDITKIEPDEIPDHDVLLAGFPCQPFSIAGVSKKNALGRPHGFECATQGTLFFDVARIIQAKKPKAFLLENVKNLLSHDGGNTFRVIRDVLEKELHYKIHWKVIDGRAFVPQHRERIIIVGFQSVTDFSWDDLRLPEVGPKLSSILHKEVGERLNEHDENRYYAHDKNRVQQKYTLSNLLWTYLQGYAEKHRAKGNGFGFGLVQSSDVSRTLSARYYKDGSEILIAQKRKNPRRLTPRECARLMGYPDTFRIPVSDTQAYKQFGNSVIVPVMAEVARLMKPRIMTLKNPSGLNQGLLFSAAA
jgi:DNA (cytosine-5)-methyltransferase 1